MTRTVTILSTAVLAMLAMLLTGASPAWVVATARPAVPLPSNVRKSPTPTPPRSPPRDNRAAGVPEPISTKQAHVAFGVARRLQFIGCG